MESERAIEIWRHHGWGGVVGWIVERVPSCDPTVAAVHAVRRAEHRIATAGPGSSAAMPARGRPCVALDRSGATAHQAGITLDDFTRRLISESIDIAVDWWADFADQVGATGMALLTEARTTDRINGRVRLRTRFSGAAGCPW